ncbi:MAG: ribonuclease III [Clostridiales bacterium]|nr:ribonuclease III [Clostridiales bacterium]
MNPKISNNKDWKKFEGIIKYEFNNKSLLRQALTHSSYSNERQMHKLYNNERLEFLGDAVLELITSEYLYKSHPNVPEGNLTKLRATYVRESSLAYCARQMDLGNYLFLGKGEDATGGRERDSILSDALEAIIGGIFLDGGFTNAKEFVTKEVLNRIEQAELFFDSKTILQELVQSKYTDAIVYELINEEGPDHNKEFTVAVTLNNEKLGEGKGRTKKAAEQQAAHQAIKKIKAGE